MKANHTLDAAFHLFPYDPKAKLQTTKRSDNLEHKVKNNNGIHRW
jgi:hypothetical protein